MSNNHGQAAHANSTAGATSGDGFVAGADPSGFNGTEHWNSAPATFNQKYKKDNYFLIQQQTLLKKRYQIYLERLGQVVAV